jgi:type II secretory pathway pseudopilin PulG
MYSVKERTLVKRKFPGQTKGFSMVELVFAIAVIATSLLLFVGIFFTMFRATQKGVDLTAGTVVAESKLASFLYNVQEHSESPYDTRFPNGLDSLKDDGSVVDSGGEDLNRVKFSYEIRSWKVSTDPALVNLRKVEITTWWWGDNNNPTVVQNKAGYGKLSVVISRLVYTKNKLTLNH